MPYRKLLIFGVSITLSALACRKERSQEAPPANFHCGYAPYTVGSSFTYQYINSGGSTTQYILSVRADTTINGKVYSILNDGSLDQFIRCDNGRYYLYEQAISLPEYELAPGNRIFLRDDFPIGATWTDTIYATISGLKQTGLLKYRIISREPSYKVLGRNYSNVVTVRQDASILIGESEYPVGTVATYRYAYGVGYVETTSPTDTVRLIDYSIN